MKRYLFVFGVMLIAASLWIFTPVYQFLAHRGKAPLPPWGWLALNGPAPEIQELSEPSFDSAGNRTLAAMAKYREDNNLPSLSAAVAVREQLVWAGAVGFSDIADKVPATPDTLYRIGSTSKALTGTALAKLVQRGELDLDAPISAQGFAWDEPSAATGHSGWATLHADTDSPSSIMRSLAQTETVTSQSDIT